MLRTNTKKAIANIRKYVVDNFMAYDYTTYSTFTETAKEIYRMFREEFFNGTKKGWYKTEFEGFFSWSQGLSGGGVFDFWTYSEGNNPINILGDILEETETERNRYSEEKASSLLVNLIYREIKKEV